MSKATLRAYVRALKVWGSYLFEEGYTKANVFFKIKQPSDSKRVIDILSEEEIIRIFAAVNPATKMGARMYAILSLLLDTGMRIGELEKIAFEDIDFRQHRIKITGKGQSSGIMTRLCACLSTAYAGHAPHRKYDAIERKTGILCLRRG